MKTREHRIYTGWVLVERDEDAEEMHWVSHCLDFDIVAMGRTPKEAIESVRECVGVALCDDLNEGLDPYTCRNRAPEAEWSRLWSVVNNGRPIKISDIDVDTSLVLATQVVVSLEKINHDVVADHAQPAALDRLNSFASLSAAA